MTHPIPDISAISYDPATGIFSWAQRPDGRFNKRVGLRAGFIVSNKRSQEYRSIKIAGKMYLEHRLAFVFMFNRWPANEVDHINGDGTDNRWANLRDATSAQNKWNQVVKSSSVSGLKGVSFDFRRGKFKAQIRSFGRREHLGYFNFPEDAHAAYCRRAVILRGEFANSG